MTPQDACNFVCHRIVELFQGNPLFNLKMVALSKTGETGSCSVRGRDLQGQIAGLGYCVHDFQGHRMLDGNAVLGPLTDDDLLNLPLR